MNLDGHGPPASIMPSMADMNWNAQLPGSGDMVGALDPPGPESSIAEGNSNVDSDTDADGEFDNDIELNDD